VASTSFFPASLGDRPLDVIERAAQCALQHDAHLPLVGGVEALSEEIERALGVRAPLHIEADKGVERLRLREDLGRDRLAEVVADVLAERGELHRDVGVELAPRHLVEEREILPPRLPRLRLVRDRLAEEVERRRDALRVQLGDGVTGAGDRLAGHEARGKALGEPVVPDEAEDPRLAGEIEQEGAKH